MTHVTFFGKLRSHLTKAVTRSTGFLRVEKQAFRLQSDFSARPHRGITDAEISPVQKRQEYAPQPDKSTDSARAIYRVALAICCIAIGVASAWILAIAVLETKSFMAIEAAFVSAPIMDNVPKIDVGAFRPRLIAMGVDGLIMVFVCWFLFGRRSEFRAIPVSRSDVKAGMLLFVLSGLALMSYVGSCFLHIPLLERACSLHAKEGVIDTFHPIAFGASALLLGLTALKSLRTTNSNRIAPIAFLGLAVALFVVAMEEISWGQTFLGWRTPDSVSSWNYQNETNLHNAFNFVLGRAYLAAGIIGFLAVSISIMIRRKFPEHPASAILPTAPMFWGALWLPPASQSGVYTDTEPFESIVAILSLYFAFQIWSRNRHERQRSG